MEFPNSGRSLFLADVPPAMNTVSKLNERFQKFGDILKVSACHDNNPRTAVITFSKVEEAIAAYNTSKYLLNIKYIRNINEMSSVAPHSSNVLFGSSPLLIPPMPKAKAKAKPITTGTVPLKRKCAPKKPSDHKIKALKDDNNDLKRMYIVYMSL